MLAQSISCFSHVSDGTRDRKQGCTLAYTVPGDTSIMAEPSWLQKLEEAGHIE